MRAGDRRRLERLCRYVLRRRWPQEALDLTAEGRVLLRLRGRGANASPPALPRPSTPRERHRRHVQYGALRQSPAHTAYAPDGERPRAPDGSSHPLVEASRPGTVRSSRTSGAQPRRETDA
ncbi:MAG: hypothetical protein U0802_10700 [Candidatus Binatia bacterium]